MSVQKIPVALCAFVACSAFAFEGPTADTWHVPALRTHARNEGIREEIEGDPDRVLPKSDHLRAAVDTEFYKRSTLAEDYYHGLGFWLDSRIEAEPHAALRLNLRPILYNGTSSQGYNHAFGFFVLAGVTWAATLPPLGVTVEARGGDLDRQTLGVGLTLEEKEMNGLGLQLARGDFKARTLVNGTGGYYFLNDLWYQDVSYRDGLFGASGQLIARDGPSSPADGRPTFTLFSTREWVPGLRHRLEAGLRGGGTGGLAAVDYRGGIGNGRFEWLASGAVRHYDRAFVNRLATQMSPVYLAYDQADKPFANVFNLWIRGEKIRSAALSVEAHYRITPHFGLLTGQELATFRYETSHITENFYFYRVGLEIFPLDTRRDRLTLNIANKLVRTPFEPRNLYVSAGDREIKRQSYFWATAHFEI